VIEFVLGLIVGLASAGLFRSDGDELEAENHELRDGLRHVAGVLRNRPELPSLVRYVDRLLDEGGA